MAPNAAENRTPVAAARTRPALQDWLEARAEQLGASSAAVLVRQGDETELLGVLPEDGPAQNRVIDAARQALLDQYVVRRADADAGGERTHVQVCVGLRARIFGKSAAVAFTLLVPVDKTDAAIMAEIVPLFFRPTKEGTAEPSPSVAREAIERAPAAILADVTPGRAAENAPDATSPLLLEQRAVISTLAATMDQRELRRSLHAFANSVAQNWRCLRVTVGLVRSKRIVIEAVSGEVDFDTRSALMVDVKQALEETRAAASVIVLPPSGGDAAPQGHTVLAALLKIPALLSLPLVDGDRVVGALLLERDREFSADEERQLQRMALLLGPVVALKMLEAMAPRQWLWRFAHRYLEAWLGSTRLGLKLAAIAAVLVALWSSVYTQTFRIGSDARIEASVQRAVVAGIPTFLAEVDKKAGDVVREGDVLAQLDTESLRLERIQWVGELDKLAKEYRANLAQRDRSNIRILEARSAQAKTRIDLIDAQMARATLRAPIDGVVISGDLSQTLGAPVERGQVLLEVASLDDYRLVLMVDETDIGWVQVGQTGALRLRSLPDRSFAFSVSAITPVSTAERGDNRFRVEASLTDAAEGLRPGMEGVAKIDIEQRPIGWIWTRSFVDWLRVVTWKYRW